MSQTEEGAVIVAARQVGVPPDEYATMLQAGFKWCVGCREWHESILFGYDRSRGDGLASVCRSWRQEKQARRPRRERVRSGPVADAARDGDKAQARRRVNLHVARGRIQNPNELPCADCGHRWSALGRAALAILRHEYDHYMGYGAAHHLDVQAVCSSCHHERERRRRP